MKITANLKDKMTENIECQCLTRNIKNWAESPKYERVSINKQRSKLKNCSF